MRHISTKSNIMVASVDFHFEDVYQKPYFAKEYLEEIKKANLLLLPSENIREGLEPVFPELTSDFLRYLKEHASEEVRVDIAVDDEHYRKLVLHSAPAALATIIIREDILEQTANLVIGFLKKTAEKYHRFEEEMDTFVNVFVDGTESCRKIMFSGRVSECKGSLDMAIGQVFRGEKIENED